MKLRVADIIFDTHRVLKPHTPDTSWRKDWKSILNYTGPIAA